MKSHEAKQGIAQSFQHYLYNKHLNPLYKKWKKFIQWRELRFHLAGKKIKGKWAEENSLAV